MDVSFFIISRYNLYIEKFRAAANITNENYLNWCERRYRLIRSITLPSVLRQRHKTFRWVIFFDTEINEPIQKTLDLIAPHKNILCIFHNNRFGMARNFAKAMPDEVVKLASPGNLICTTRLDTDDALHEDFMVVLNREVSKAKDKPVPASGIAFNVPVGSQRVGDRLFSYVYDQNPFLSVLEDPAHGAVVTAMGFAHFAARERMEVRQILDRRPLWMQVIHDNNAENAAKPDLPEITPASYWLNQFGVGAA